jgi:hypothetical protein
MGLNHKQHQKEDGLLKGGKGKTKNTIKNKKNLKLKGQR